MSAADPRPGAPALPAAADPLGDRLMAIVWRTPAESIAERTRRRITARLMPVLFILYILAYLDRANVSAAELKMKLPVGDGGLAFTPEIIGFGSGLFFLGYWILEIPSTLSVRRFGARWVFCRILVLWGICATLVGFIGLPIAAKAFGWFPTIGVASLAEGSWLFRAAQFFNELPTSAENQFYFFRFMLGFFEGGFFPCVIVYLTYWYRSADRAKAVAGFTAASPLSMALGLPASGLLLNLDWFGLPGWRWIFILEGLLPVIAGIAVLWCLPDRPEKARWLPEDERDWLLGELEREHAAKLAAHGQVSLSSLLKVLLLTTVYFCLNIGVYGLVMFMPAIIKSQLAGHSDVEITMLASLPYFMAVGGMYFNGWHSDRKNERVWHTATPLLIVSLGVLLAGLLDGVPIVPVVIMICVVGPCMFAHMPTFWPIPTMFLGAAMAASAIGFINMVGNLGGTVGPYLVGKAAKPETAQVAPAEPKASGVVEPKASINAAGAQVDAGAANPADRKPGPEKTAASDNYRESLFRLAPWPAAAAFLIVIVGLLIRPPRPATGLSP